MALRSTSPAVRLMQQSRRMSLASVPVHYQSIVYELGKHHRPPNVCLANLPFPTTLSATFGLPVMKDAHVLFLTTLVSESRPEHSGRPQLFHSFSSYRKSLPLI
jgi:hypothetical protein